MKHIFTGSLTTFTFSLMWCVYINNSPLSKPNRYLYSTNHHLLYSICSLCNLLCSLSLDTKYKKWNQKTQENAVKGRKASMLKYFVSSKDHSFKDFAGQIDTNWWNQHIQQQKQNFSGYLRNSGMEVPVCSQLLQVEIPSSYVDHLLFESLSGFPRMMTTECSQVSKQVAFEPL